MPTMNAYYLTNSGRDPVEVPPYEEVKVKNPFMARPDGVDLSREVFRRTGTVLVKTGQTSPSFK